MNCKNEIISILNQIEKGGVSREGLQRTPERVERAYEFLFKGYKENPEEILSRQFEAESNNMIVVRNIGFASVCEHHILPFIGVAHIGYIPSKKIVGLSKLARLVECYARRLQIQERMQKQIVDDIETYVNATGVGVILKARHLCMGMRGVQKMEADTITSIYRGCFTQTSTKHEFLKLIGEI